jgi:acyl-CoA reductase-like NAD-dependent aldehyde dehydrogenase
LGGNNDAFIVLEDADIDAVDNAQGRMNNNGVKAVLSKKELLLLNALFDEFKIAAVSTDESG